MHFKIDTTPPANIDIYRLAGYAGTARGSGARASSPLRRRRAQPGPQEDLDTGPQGLLAPGGVGAHWEVPACAVSGIYIARLERDDTLAPYAFIFRDDASYWIFVPDQRRHVQAYNGYGGNSLYVGSTTFPAGMRRR